MGKGGAELPLPRGAESFWNEETSPFIWREKRPTHLLWGSDPLKKRAAFEEN
jgi:hypothetical protein